MTPPTRRLSLALSLLPALAGAAQVPSPRDVFGFAPGADYELARHGQIVRYFNDLAAASDRVVLEEIGHSTLGKPMILALISSEANIARRDELREIARRLANARDLDADAARQLAKEGRAIVWIDGGLHATEVAHAQHTPELAHWLATSESDEARRVRDEAILLLMPVMNPDGLDIVVDWYEKNLGTPFETTRPPVLYHHYIGHDNNRDWYMFTQVETQAVARILYHRWFPQIVYNHHQSSPWPGRIWGPPFENPVNPNLDPLVVSSINLIGEAMRKRFDEEGKPGYNSGIVFDMWWNGSMRGAPDYHNMLGFLTETALYRYATPHCYDADEVPESFGARANNLPAQRPTTDYTNPWRGGCWRLRDAVDYMLTASRAVLDIGAKLREDFLFNIYRMGRRQIARGERAEGGPFAYVIDLGAQHDPGAAVELLRVFRTGGIEVVRADASFEAGGRSFPKGSYVIGPQAFRPFVIDLMEPKTYPDRRQYPGGPPDPPYDMTGYELSLQMGVTAERVMEAFEMPGALIDRIPAPAGGVSGRGETFLVSHSSNSAVLATNRLLGRGAVLSWTRASLDVDGKSWPPGTIVVSGVERDTVRLLASELGLEVSAVSGVDDASLARLAAPRVGLYKSHAANMAEGWTRWLLERYAFQLESLDDAAIRGGDLSRFDVIVLPDQRGDQILGGHATGTMPDEFVGGLGVEGALALLRFVEGGGSLVAIDEAIDFAIRQLGLPVRNTVSGLDSQDFFIPGSLLNLDVEPDHPIAHGMPGRSIAFFVRSQALELLPMASEGEKQPERKAEVFLRYAAEDLLASGWQLGGDRHVAGKAAGMRLPLGDGDVVLLGFRPHFRGQPHGTFKLLFNALHASALETAGGPR